MEIIVKVSENDEVLGGVDRAVAHGTGRILHREADFFLINKYGVLLDLRVKPPKWCHIGGHPEYDEKIHIAED